MNRGAWWATVYGVTESDMTEQVRLGKLLTLLLPFSFFIFNFTASMISFRFWSLLFFSFFYWSSFTMLLVSARKQSESATCVHTFPLPWISFPFRLLQSFE